MESHQINVEDLKKWMDETETIYAIDPKNNKKLTVSQSGWFTVYYNNEVVSGGNIINLAVKRYNSIEFKEHGTIHNANSL